ncbi:recombinase family protein [Streptomyces sp. NPDC006514]|uniref:recombinase family protein n=1 Tax=Streptomyces sp. NPDC006514 TaxID=3154308 RepID=UPI0033BB5A50
MPWAARTSSATVIATPTGTTSSAPRARHHLLRGVLHRARGIPPRPGTSAYDEAAKPRPLPHPCRRPPTLSCRPTVEAVDDAAAGPEPALDPALLARAGDRIGYARVSSQGQDLAGQVRLLKKANCVRVYVEKIGTREKIRPEYNAALADLRPADTLTVTMLDRLGRNMIELITAAQDLAERDHRPEILSGPLAGMYDPQGAGKVLFVMFAAMAEVEREFIHERTLMASTPRPRTATTAAAAGRRRRHARHRAPTPPRQRPRHLDRPHLGVGRSTLYRTLSTYDEAVSTGPLCRRRRPPRTPLRRALCRQPRGG